MNRRKFIAASMAALSGCGGLQPRVEKNVIKCCDKLSGAQYLNYAEGTLVLVTLNEESPQYAFPTGLSVFAGFQFLSKPQKDSVLEVVTEYEGIWLPSTTVFVPRFAFLDESFTEISSNEPQLFQSTGRLYQTGFIRKEFYGACFVPARTAYIVTYTDVSALKARPVKYLSPGGMGASLALERAREEYKRIDKREFAGGKVNHFMAGPGFAQFDIPRTAFGKFRFSIS